MKGHVSSLVTYAPPAVRAARTSSAMVWCAAPTLVEFSGKLSEETLLAEVFNEHATSASVSAAVVGATETFTVMSEPPTRTEQNPGRRARPRGGDRVRCPRPHKLDGGAVVHQHKKNTSHVVFLFGLT
jgi:hypothetical protein